MEHQNPGQFGYGPRRNLRSGNERSGQGAVWEIDTSAGRSLASVSIWLKVSG